MGELTAIFGELVRMLKELPPGGFDKAYGPKPPSSAAAKSQSFLCDKQSFKDVIRMAEWGAKLAEQAHSQAESPTDPVVDTVLAGFKFLEAKVDQLALDTANLAAKQASSAKTFVEAVAVGKPNGPLPANAKAGGKGKKPPSTSNPEFTNSSSLSSQRISRTM